jgi:hypothetical protein
VSDGPAPPPPGPGRTGRAEAALALAVAAWRLAAPSPQGFWRDWILVLAVYWAFTALARTHRSWPWVSAGTALDLFAVHAARQLPLTLEHLRQTL